MGRAFVLGFDQMILKVPFMNTWTFSGPFWKEIGRNTVKGTVCGIVLYCTVSVAFPAHEKQAC